MNMGLLDIYLAPQKNFSYTLSQLFEKTEHSKGGVHIMDDSIEEETYTNENELVN